MVRYSINNVVSYYFEIYCPLRFTSSMTSGNTNENKYQITNEMLYHPRRHRNRESSLKLNSGFIQYSDSDVLVIPWSTSMRKHSFMKSSIFRTGLQLRKRHISALNW